MKKQIRFTEGFFNLRKWRANDADLTKLLSETSQNDTKPGKIPGILWEEIGEI